jgi:hypothetical protein
MWVRKSSVMVRDGAAAELLFVVVRCSWGILLKGLLDFGAFSFVF